MKYVALLRGINVGGNSMVKMSDLKDAFLAVGFSHVITYINSGNILFESNELDNNKLIEKIETLLKKSFFAIRVIILSQEQLQHVIKEAPKNWKNDNLRKYIAFIKHPSTPEDVFREAQLKENVDFLDKGQEVVYMTTKMEGLTKSSFPKLNTKKIYQNITIRNYNTVLKLLNLMRVINE